MLTYKRYQSLHAIHIRIPGEPGNKATLAQQWLGLTQTYGFVLTAKNIFVLVITMTTIKCNYIMVGDYSWLVCGTTKLTDCCHVTPTYLHLTPTHITHNTHTPVTPTHITHTHTHTSVTHNMLPITHTPASSRLISPTGHEARDDHK